MGEHGYRRAVRLPVGRRSGIQGEHLLRRGVQSHPAVLGRVEGVQFEDVSLVGMGDDDSAMIHDVGVAVPPHGDARDVLVEVAHIDHGRDQTGGSAPGVDQAAGEYDDGLSVGLGEDRVRDDLAPAVDDRPAEVVAIGEAARRPLGGEKGSIGIGP